MKPSATIAAAGFLLLGAGPAPAQQFDLSGDWRCQMAGRAHSNDLTQMHNWDFVLSLAPDRSFQAQGTYYSPSMGFTETFSGSGTWQSGNDAQGRLTMAANGTWIRSYGGAMTYPIVLEVQNERTMIYNHQDQYTRSHYMCQR